MSKGSSKAPQAPDPNVVAGAQTQQNKDAALYNAMLNRVNTYSPLGSQEFTQTGTDPTTGAPITRQDIKLDPQTEQLLRQQQGNNLQMGSIASGMMGRLPQQPFSFSGLPGMSTDFDALRDKQSKSLYDRNAAFLDPQFKQSEDALRSRMANQGIVEGSEAATNAMGDFNRGKEFSYGQARDSAIAGGGAEADRQFGMEAQRRSMMANEMMMERNQPYQELSAINGMTSPAELPQFQGMSTVGTSPADITSPYMAQYQGLIDAYNAKQGGKNNMLGGLFSLGSAALMGAGK
jgi:hypothetical protein